MTYLLSRPGLCVVRRTRGCIDCGACGGRWLQGLVDLAVAAAVEAAPVRAAELAIGAAENWCAKDAREVRRSGLSPTMASSQPAVFVPTPGSASSCDAAVATTRPNSASASAISAVSCHRCGSRRRSATRTATAGSATSMPGRVAGRRAVSLTVPRFRRGSRTAAGSNYQGGCSARGGIVLTTVARLVNWP